MADHPPDISGGGNVLPSTSSSDQKVRLHEGMGAGITSLFKRLRDTPAASRSPSRTRSPEVVEEAMTLADLRAGKKPAKKRKPVVTEDDGGFNVSEVLQRTASDKPRSGASMAAGALSKMKIPKRS